MLCDTTQIRILNVLLVFIHLGLYHQAIIMSGSPLSYWAIMTEFVKPEYRRHVADYLKLVGCTGEDVAVVKRCLKSKSEKDIMGTYLKASTFIY